jgi:hypothetical protein
MIRAQRDPNLDDDRISLGRLDPLALQWVVIVHEVFNGPLVGRGCVRVPAARA